MSDRRFLVLLLAPLGALLAIGILMALLEGEQSPIADRLGTLFGAGYGIYAVLLFRRRKGSS